jgi:alpha-L-rhamnosidase
MSAIWLEDSEKADEVFLRARKSFRANRDGSPCILRVTCSGRYRLWLNGEPVASGPAHSGTAVRRVDEIEVSGHLREGENLIAVQLIHFRYFTAHAYCPEPAFWCLLQGGGVDLESDTTWRISREEAFQFPSFRRNLKYGPQEIYDGRLEDPWLAADYDDAHWPQAIEVTAPWAGREFPRGIPQIQEFDLRPLALSRIAEVLDQEHFPGMWSYQSYQSLAVTLLQDVPEEPSLTIVSGAENLIDGGTGSMEICQPFVDRPDQAERRCATVIFDFGREINGYGWLDVEGNDGAMVDMVYGELLTAGRVQAMRQGTHYADRYILREGRQRHRVYDWKGFRFLQLTFRNLTRPLVVHGVGATFCTYPVEPRGAFQCSDPLVRNIWTTGAYTQQLCLHDRLMDCPWRNRRGMDTDLPGFVYPWGAFTEDRFCDWIRDHQIDAVVTMKGDLYPSIKRIQKSLSRPVGFSVLDHPGDKSSFSGIDQNAAELGRVAVDQLVDAMNHNLTGLPKHPLQTLIQGCWHEAASTRKLRGHHPPAPLERIKLMHDHF